jgi:hypothetical protein
LSAHDHSGESLDDGRVTDYASADLDFVMSRIHKRIRALQNPDLDGGAIGQQVAEGEAGTKMILVREQ